MKKEVVITIKKMASSGSRHTIAYFYVRPLNVEAVSEKRDIPFSGGLSIILVGKF
ncbi:hypothetical protein [Bacillus sp. FJAT-44742]|uniref:hypothetical protein n=1 Tax=Bacillus sp. FJAT-44742 TaxID=2014005 RepID=UPI0012FEA210|nr:hypothetical protein [Bacillus sp. FJAT-44742]